MQEPALEIGTPRKAEARRDRTDVVPIDPVVCLHKSDRTCLINYWSCRQRRAHNRRAGNEGIPAHSDRREINLPANAIVQGEIRSKLPFVLSIEVKLIQVRLHPMKGDLVSHLEWQEYILISVAQKVLRHAERNSKQVNCCALKPAKVCTVHSQGCRSSETRRRTSAAERNRRRETRSARQTALIHVSVETKVSAEAKDMSAGHNTEIIKNLRSGYYTSRSGNVQVWLARVRKIKRRNIRKVRVRLSKRKEEIELGKPCGELINHSR